MFLESSIDLREGKKSEQPEELPYVGIRGAEEVLKRRKGGPVKYRMSTIAQPNRDSTHLVEIENTRHFLIQPDRISCTLSELFTRARG